MLRRGKTSILVWAACVLAGAALLYPSVYAGGKRSNEAPRASCTIQPRMLDVRAAAGTLVVRIEVSSPDGLTPLPSDRVEPGVWVASVGETLLPRPDGESEGISESLSARTYEDAVDVRSGVLAPNGVRELVARFVDPSDGDPKTREDGNASDVLAMLMDTPDGQSAEVCLAGRVAGAAFQCCDAVTVRNQGLRDLPRGLLPLKGSDRG